MHQEPNGELSEDAVWRWSSLPDRYLDSALRLAFASSAELRLVDAGGVSTLAVTLTTWHLESADRTHLVGTIEFVLTTADRTVVTQVVREAEPVSPEMPGDLAAGAGRLLNRLAGASLAETARALRP